MSKTHNIIFDLTSLRPQEQKHILPILMASCVQVSPDWSALLFISTFHACVLNSHVHHLGATLHKRKYHESGILVPNKEYNC